MSTRAECVGNGPRAQLRWLLTRQAATLGLTPESIDALARFAEFARTSAGQLLCAIDRPSKFVRYSLTGVVKVVCAPDGHDPLVVRFLPPGSFFCVPSEQAGGSYRVTMVAHEAGLVAL